MKENGIEESLVFDTSAIFALVLDEPGADIVTKLSTDEKSRIYLSFLTLYEIQYVCLRRFDKPMADEIVTLILSQDWIIDNDTGLSMIKLASNFKAWHKMSVADSWIAALAFNVGGTLVHKDPEFEALKDQIELLSLPNK